ncbi:MULTISPECIES: long-chain-fatty-acid--CoA ligase [Sphingobium]|uniref:Dicarboxylate--CoA ligase PimA n=2 Tax=Sphingobium fuliginis (strain ATCC 27551) TaxID=336203 RepID=A0ABQ1EQS0_SPHSA|nr:MULTISPECIES: long-chain fatty acid--CoA ligase [Sphingobium]OAP32946.1 dicarboxylate--CoA ligase PimA [Sphingobium sp. 20006FA]AJR25845.1 AMP-dependent synthetase [Sphingobium sp. YBL2]KXU32562.1 dicarboxylate--CoA ligase PimA [Sphingobium sp. AM]KYC32619.1 dicarboxylate--CoA ligase PimA [Sphingobium sp. 22B]QDC37523.1 long-chain fatty acid--CoA ligase [Sphingobium fuliginis ATCC 27551]
MESSEKIWKTRYNHPSAWEQTFPPLSMVEMVANSAAANPQAVMIDFMGRKTSYGEMLHSIRRVARGLQDMGIEKGDRVGLFLPNVPHYVAAYYGAMMAGATVVNYSPLYTAAELEHQVEDSGTKILFTLSAKALLPTALEVLDNSSLERLVVGCVAEVLPPAKSVLFRLFKRKETVAVPHDPRLTHYADLLRHGEDPVPVAIDPEQDIALLQYTGGTTGRPKGAMLTHQNLTANARQVRLIDPHPEAPDRILAVLPFFHVFANTCVLNRTVLNGGEMVMLPRFDGTQVLAALQRTRATSLPGVPTMYQALLDHPATPNIDFSSLRLCISGGAPLPLEVKQRFEAMTGSKLVEGYGLTESSPVVCSNPYEGLNKSGTVGQPVPGTRVKLVDREDPTRPPPEGEPGELVFSGPQIMKGYWQRPDADEEVFVDGWLRTGDVGLIDEDGYVKIVDRLKDMIAVGGFKVFPSEVEKVLYHHPAVKEALVIGIPDHYRGECPKAFVTLQEGSGIDGAALKDWLNPQLGKHEKVCEVEVRLNLPKTLVGKLSRKELVAEERAKAEAAMRQTGTAG